MAALRRRPRPTSTDLYKTGTTNPYSANGTAIETLAIRDQAGVLGDLNNDSNVDLIMGIYTTTNNPNVGGTVNDRVFLNLGFGCFRIWASMTVPWLNRPTPRQSTFRRNSSRTRVLSPVILRSTGRLTRGQLRRSHIVGTGRGRSQQHHHRHDDQLSCDPVTITDLVITITPPQFWAMIGAQSGELYSSITVNDPTGGAGDHILVSTDSGPRKDMIYQDVVIPNDPSVTQYTVTWRMAYWNLDFINHDPQFHTAAERQPQYIALYVYDPTKPISSPVWTTTQGTSPVVVNQLQDYSVTITDPALRGTKVRIGLEVFSGDNFLQVAVDDFHINPTRTMASSPSAGANPAADAPLLRWPILAVASTNGNGRSIFQP